MVKRMPWPSNDPQQSKASLMRLRLQHRDALFGLALTLPALAFLAVFLAKPLLETVLLSFQSSSLLEPDQPAEFVGLSNWQSVLTGSTFPSDLRNTVVLAVASTVLQIVLGLAVALLLNQAFKLRRIVRSAVVLPWAMPTIAAAFAFRWMFDSSFGAVNSALGLAGIGSVPWLGTPVTAMATLVVAVVWKGLPFVILVFLASLQTVPKELYEAAQVDGASKWREFLHVTLPHMRFVIAIVLVLRVIWTFNWFDMTWLLTGGGPGTSTRTLPLDVYIQAFRNFDVGTASTYATFMAGVLMIFALVFLRLTTRKEDK